MSACEDKQTVIHCGFISELYIMLNRLDQTSASEKILNLFNLNVNLYNCQMVYFMYDVFHLFDVIEEFSVEHPDKE